MRLYKQGYPANKLFSPMKVSPFRKRHKCLCLNQNPRKWGFSALMTLLDIRNCKGRSLCLPVVDDIFRGMMIYRQKLLVIEPDADTAQLLDESLTAQGYDVRLTDSAGGAMLLLRYYEPDAVLLA